ncbi:hypothetical protein GCM10009665_27340 [Kitasatospora nipponensis]|uniref:Uncharacterized protein n=1 Tax=Kitasatospora nipponensis TaxID=258049 RepID=A0ABN1W4W1_9ACTN
MRGHEQAPPGPAGPQHRPPGRPFAAQAAAPAPPTRRAPTPQTIIALQRGVGNAAVARLLRDDGPPPAVQRALWVTHHDPTAVSSSKDESRGTTTEISDPVELIELLRFSSSQSPLDLDVLDDAEALVLEITRAYVASSTPIRITLDELESDIKKRLTLIKYMRFINGDDSPFSYSSANEWTMPKGWRSIRAKGADDDEERPTIHENVAYLSEGDHHSVIKDLFRGGRDEAFYTDCSFVITALHYRALAEALNPAEFNARYPKGVVLHPAGYGLDLPGEQHWENNAPLVHGPNPAVSPVPLSGISGPADLVPGDWVYFENFSTYDATHADTANWAGEHSLYMGDGTFQGFGSDTDPCSYQEMVRKLISAYNTGLEDGAARRTDLEKSPRSISGQLPGITGVWRLRKVVDGAAAHVEQADSDADSDTDEKTHSVAPTKGKKRKKKKRGGH